MTLSIRTRLDAATGSQRPGWVLACACVCTVLVVGLVAATNLAVPQIAASGLRPSASQLLWIVDAYVLVFACLVIPAGAVGDRFGRKGVLIGGLLTFAAGAVICAVAPSVAVALIGRVVTGIGAAAVLPNCVGVIVHATPPARRGPALALWGTVSGMGGVVGNTLGGVVLTTGSWRVLFAAVAPIAVVLAGWTAVSVNRSGRTSRPLDPTGTVLLVVAAVALLVGIIEGPERGWSSTVVLVAFAVGAALAVVWVVVEFRLAHPLLDPRLFRIVRLRQASLGMFVMFFGSFGLFFLNASLLQCGRGFSVLVTGFAILPLAAPLVLVSRLVPRVVARFGVGATLGVAFLLTAAGLFGLSTTVDAPYVDYAAWLVVTGAGFALALPTLSMQITAALPAEQAGVGGGLQAATREFGSAIGIAVVGTVLTSVFAAHLPASLTDRAVVPRTVAEALAAAPHEHVAISAAFSSGASTALQVASVVTLVAGALVVGGSWRRTGSVPA